MHFVLPIVLVLHFGIFFCRSDWVKISQSSEENRSISGTGAENEPSPAWIEYQKERFRGTNVSQRLMVSGESNLKTSSEIIVPAKVNDSHEKRNKVIRTTTKVAVQDSRLFETSTKAIRKVTKPPPAYEASDNTNFTADLKLPSFVGFLDFLSSLQQNLVRKSSSGIIDKINILRSIRDQLMLNIGNRFSIMFPKTRQRRALSDESSFQFPSEAALLSISFLTFSVFLIKLVLQVIHIIKSKHYAYNGIGMNNMTTNRLKRSAMMFDNSLDDLEMMRKVSAAIGVNPFTVK